MEENELRPYIKEYIEKSYSVQQPYFILIEEIIFRRAIIYGFDTKRVELDLERGAKFLKNIIIGKPTIERDNIASYYEKDRTIIFNEEKIKDINEPLFLLIIFAHEFSHALCVDEDEDIGTYDILATKIYPWGKTQRNLYTGSYNIFLLELIVTKLSERLFLKGYNNDDLLLGLNDYDSKDTAGYRNSSSLLEMLEVAYGMGEIEFLKYAVNGRDSLAYALSQITGLSKQKAYDILDRIEAQYTVIHNLLYNNQVHTDKMTEYNDLKNNFSYLFNNCLAIITKRIRAKEINSIDDARNYVEQLKYEYNRIIKLAKKFISTISNSSSLTEDLTEDENKDHKTNILFRDFFYEVQNNLQIFINRINEMESVLNTNIIGVNPTILLETFNKTRVEDTTDKAALPPKNNSFFYFDVDENIIEKKREPDVLKEKGLLDYEGIARIAADLIRPGWLNRLYECVSSSNPHNAFIQRLNPNSGYYIIKQNDQDISNNGNNINGNTEEIEPNQ